MNDRKIRSFSPEEEKIYMQMHTDEYIGFIKRELDRTLTQIEKHKKKKNTAEKGAEHQPEQHNVFCFFFPEKSKK